MEQRMGAIAREAGQLVLQAKNITESVAQKGSPRDLVTEYDTRVQELLRRRLAEEFPRYGFFGEEEKQHDIPIAASPSSPRPPRPRPSF